MTVWAKHGRIWYPAQICTQIEIPEHVLQKLTQNIQGKVFIKWWGGATFQSSQSKMLNHWCKTNFMNTE